MRSVESGLPGFVLHGASGRLTTIRSRRLVCMASSTRQGLEEVLSSGKYEGILLDQFGVLHDGRTAYVEAINCVRLAQETGAKVAIVSNTSRRSAGCAAKLEKYGYEESWFDAAVTSGELAFEVLSSRRHEFGLPESPSKIIHTNWIERGTISVDDPRLGVLPVGEDIDSADFILCHGTEGISLPDGTVKPASLDYLVAFLKKCSARKLPLVCANPDIVTVDGDELITMPGFLSKSYKDFGGPVINLGKPEEIVYEKACSLLGIQDRTRLLAIGDSLEHDILGAQRAGVDALMIGGGIFATELSISPDQASKSVDEDVLKKLVSKHAPECEMPTYALPYLRW
uniref:Uncharacterized protein n=1 Tax=Rhodosorus marinus TaxID=101924 RepID=A0A7S2ZA96_9RHOD|mmetsp:Transcript_11132/g.46477  ORF Transcript_11132/g.46477 Transcript_11132/m.46477 type:complete len:342 (+) Transcript_11132:334-1359(+)